LEENNSEKFTRTQTYKAANKDVAPMAAIRLLLGDKRLPPTVATNTKIVKTLVFAQFKYDQSMDIFLRRLIVERREKCKNGLPPASALEALYPLQFSLMAASSSAIDEWINDGSFSARSTS
jgi:hypothetical protein